MFMQSALSQIKEKYRLAMVQSAQLENERSQLQYQTQLLKDILEDQEDQFYRLSAEHKTTCQVSKSDNYIYVILILLNFFLSLLK